ncbi:MAG: LuxR C-terminal-related transcriptional regulator [Anaerolineales bacterium]|nr:LuxR C-terminal-related transcriptional regulator [Anaerolineales bacterium]
MEQLLTTKLYIPSTRPELVTRPRLIERLNEGLHRKLTLISAPAGFGKTTLVSDWVGNLRLAATNESQTTYRIAWLSLDEDDNDPARFLTYFITALQMMGSSIGQKAQTVFQSQQELMIDPILMTLVNDLTQLSEPPSEHSNKDFVLILDDYHVIEEPCIHNAIEFLLDHLPPRFHLVILTRIDPPLPIPRLRVRNQMVEIRGSNLHFSEKEVEIFLNENMKLGLATEEIAMLETRTEGWIAGLQLAAISLQGQINRQEFIQDFSGDNRFVIDYLLDEVLLKQPEDVRRFLLQTVVLQRMCGELCDAVVNLSDEGFSLDSQGFLEYLDRANLFIVPLDDQRKWYRYHHLFSEVLFRRLKQTELAQIPELHLRASKWFEDEGDHDQALHHALAAGDLERAAQLVEQNALQLLVHSNLTRLKKWCEALPNDLVHSRPWLCIYQGWLHLLIGKLEDANRCLQDAEQLLSATTAQEKIEDQEVYGHISIIKSHIALKKGELRKANELADQTLDYIRKQSPVHGHIAEIKGLAAFWEGDLEAADQALSEAVSIAQYCDHRFMAVDATIWLGYIKTLQGRLHQAIRYYRESIQLADLGNNRKLPIAGSAYIGMAMIEREWNNLDVAESLLMNGYDMSSLFGNPQPWHIAMAYVKNAQGNRIDAFDEIQIAEQLEIGSEAAFNYLNIDIGRVRLWLSPVGGNLAEAVRWADDSGLKAADIPSFSQRIAYTMLARVLLAQDEMYKAYELLVRLRDDAEIGGRNGDLIEILVLQALSLQAQGDPVQAITTLERAITLAEPEGFIRIFVDEGPPMAHLLYEAISRGIAPNYVRRLLAAFPSPDQEQTQTLKSQVPKPDLVVPLSEREIEVLQLIAEGLTNPEIAARLYLSLNTVKVHSRNIYGKLGVNNRMQAGTRARALGILPST